MSVQEGDHKPKIKDIKQQIEIGIIMTNLIWIMISLNLNNDLFELLNSV